MNARSPLVLRAAWTGSLVRVFGCLAFVGLGAYFVSSGRPLGWLLIVAFAVGGIGNCLPIVLRSSLTLSDAGMTLATLTGSFSYAWSEIAEFGVWRMGPWWMTRRKWIGITFTEARRAQSRMSGVNRALSGFDAALSETYGYQAEELVALLERRRLGLPDGP